MATPTALPVPSTDPNDLLFNAEKLDEAITSGEPTYTDRLGVSRKTLAGAVATIEALNSRGAWAPATAYALKDLVLESGTWYVCVAAHTSSAAFATDSASKWRVHQGVTEADLSSSGGAALVGLDATLNYVAGTIGAAINDVILNVKQFPWLAKGDGVTDDSAAVLSAITYAGSNGLALFVPPGDYVLASLVSLASISENISIVGAGQDVSRFIVTSVAGGISLSFSSVQRLCKVSGVAFVASVAGAGKALQVAFPSTPTSWTRRCLTVRDVDIYPEDGAADYFTHGIHVSSAWHAAFDNILIRGKGNDRSMTAAFLADGNSIDISFRACRCYFGTYGVKIEGASEGIRVLDTSLVWFTAGVHVTSSSSDPELQVHHGHIRCFDYGVYAQNRNQVRISTTLFYKETTSTSTYYDIYLDNCLGANVFDNFSTDAGAGGTNTFLYGTGQGLHNVHHNDIGFRTVGVEWSATCTANKLANNSYTNVTTRVIDAATNNAVDLSPLVSNATANYIVTYGDNQTTFTNNGASATITLSLPAAVVGKDYSFHRISPQTVLVDPSGTEIIRGGAAGKYLSLNTNGAFVRLKCVINGIWEIAASYGTTSYEP